jgi:hypothetical protein
MEVAKRRSDEVSERRMENGEWRMESGFGIAAIDAREALDRIALPPSELGGSDVKAPRPRDQSLEAPNPMKIFNRS